MKVAIMGAGLAGLSCAIILEKQGIQPAIFERRSQVDDRFVNGESVYNIINRPINNCLTYLQNNYGVSLEPLNPIKETVFHSRNHSGSIIANMGAFNIRGSHDTSFVSQLAKQVNSNIIFNSEYTYEELKKEFTHIVLATGDGAYASQLGNYRCDLTVTLKGGTIEGNFVPNRADLWVNHDFSPKGYAWLLPFSEKEASVVIGYPDYKENIEKDINIMWEQFVHQLSKDLNQQFRITDKFEVTRYIMGKSLHPKIDNTYFVGNCFGALSPAFGFGQFTSILTGIYAAQDICGLDSYEKLTKSLYQNYDCSLILRRFTEKLSDSTLDFFVNNLDNALIKRANSWVFGDKTKIDFIKWASYILKPFV
jgi:flavin-dependent dehydrogenase